MDFNTIKKMQEWRIEISPVTGKPRFIANNNDVMFYVERLGGIAAVCRLFNVDVITVNLWIDESHIPQPYADKVCGLTGANIRCIQEAWSYVYDENEVWPPVRCSYLIKELGLPQIMDDGKTFVTSKRIRKVKRPTSEK
ncbi:hypothetical protein [Glaciimonas soli]|uniref:Uncharacterized protein n=1 Tax=Glaciimonas soli TaxID=2590999 RepID=A0A843YWJ8_9BURK|nr:hypothetical protein [Glaciimonas soli]MQR00956.1 hypothetical protein [Glaciimonas soli]